MKITIDAKEFEKLVSAAAQAISSKPMKPEYECVYVEVTSDSGSPIMTVMGKDVGIAIKRATDAIESREDGTALIPAKTLENYLKLMDGPVKMDVNANFLCTLKCGGKKATISCMDASDYNPDFQDLADGNLAVMDGKEFASAVGSVAHCVNENETGRMVLTGVCFAFDGASGYCEAVGTDGLRLALARKKAETNETFKALIPIGFAKLISKIIGNSEQVNFRFGNGTVIVEDYTTAIEAAQLAGEYLDYTKLLTRNGKMQGRVNAEEMADAVKMAQIACQSAQKNLIVLNFSDEGVMQVSSRSDKTESVTDVPFEFYGQMDGTQEIAFNAQYMLDALKATSAYAGEAELMMNTPNSPAVVLPVNRDDYYQLVLPVRRMT